MRNITCDFYATSGLISVNSLGKPMTTSNYPRASISGDGRYIVFKVDEINSNTEAEGIYLRDRLDKTTELVSVSSSGEPGNSYSTEPTISSDGNFIVFTSASTNLVNVHFSSRPHAGGIFVHNRLTGTTEIVNRVSITESENGYSNTPSISADGKFILFNSDSTNLVDIDLPYGWPYDGRGYITNNPPMLINIVGEPEIDAASETGMYVWRDNSGKIFIKVVAGDPLQNGQATHFIGSLKANQQITDLTPITVDPASVPPDSLIQVSPGLVEFELRLKSPKDDQFSFALDLSESLCLILNEYQGGLYLGPNKQQVLPPYDINRLTDCKRDFIEVDGKPVFDKEEHKGWFIWRENCSWHNRFVYGGIDDDAYQYRNVWASINSSEAMYNLQPFSIEPGDYLSQSPDNRLKINLNLRSGYQDGFSIQIFDHASTLVKGSSIFLGPYRIPMQREFDLKEIVENDPSSNMCDSDVDNDGVLNVDDDLPLDPNESVDTDNDNIGNNTDTDDDNDGVRDADDAFPLDSEESQDTDNDGIGNNADIDDDGDGVRDDNDNCPLKFNSDQSDTDKDGVGNKCDIVNIIPILEYLLMDEN